ncbi:MAG: hypothetical protein ACHQT8_00010 [Chlamydiales bacterium]
MSLSLAPANQALDPSKYAQWTEEEWEKFEANAQLGDPNLTLSKPFQDRFMEHLFADAAYADKIPMFFQTEGAFDVFFPNGLPSIPYAIARSITPCFKSYELIEMLWFKTGDTTTQTISRTHGNRLYAELGYWKFNTPRLKPYGEHALIEHPEICRKIKQVTHLPKVFASTKEKTFPRPMTQLTLEYLGYPQKFCSQNNETTFARINNIRACVFLSFAEVDYLQRDYFPFLLDPLGRIDCIDIPHALQKISGTIAEYVGEDDRVEKDED